MKWVTAESYLATNACVATDFVIDIRYRINDEKSFYLLIANHYHGFNCNDDSDEEITMTKTITFAAMHFTIAFGVAYLLTGSIVVGGAVALVEPAVNTVAFYFHEKVWTRLEARRQAPVSAAAGYDARALPWHPAH